MIDNPAARALFGERLGLAEEYAGLLTTDGVVRGLIGPHEAPRIWDRHLLNCAAVAELVQPDAYLVDVGSGAGLPGLVLAIARPDLSVVLLEPLARRVAFLNEVVETLGLGERVVVVRARAEEAAGRLPGGPADLATARAVAPLGKLASWCLPLLKVDGRLLAIKGAAAAEEAAAQADEVRRIGGGPATIQTCGIDLLDEATTVVEIVRERVVQPRSDDRRGGGGRRRRAGSARSPKSAGSKPGRPSR